MSSSMRNEGRSVLAMVDGIMERALEKGRTMPPTASLRPPAEDTFMIESKLHTFDDRLPVTLFCKASGVHNTDCPICLTDFVENKTRVRNWACGHVVCLTCSDENFRRGLTGFSCVLCRQ